MSFENYYGIYKDEKGVVLRPGQQPAFFDFNAQIKENKRYKLFAVGETSQFYWWKDEGDGRFLYRQITDRLSYENACVDRYSLDFSAKEPFTYMRRVYKKVLWAPVASYIPVNPIPTQWKAGIRVKAENLKFENDGFLQMRLEIHLKKEGVSRRDITVPSDISVIIPVSQGSYDYTEINRNITIPADTANVCVFVEGKNYTGKCYFEHPMLEADGHNMLPAFTEPVSGKPEFDWTGQFLSQKEFPEFCVTLNGKTVFEGEVFERIHRFSEWEINLPAELLKDQNRLEIKLISSYREPLPYTVCELALLEQPDSPVDIIAVSQFAPIAGKARVLIRTKNDNTTVKFFSESSAICAEKEYYFEEKGLHGITVNCLKAAQNVKFSLVADNFEVAGEIGSIIYKQDDNVITGTGDMVYILQKKEQMEEYISWYISQGVGDFITMRPCYRWSGTKQLDAKCVKWFADLMNELEIKYVLMVDGREIPGLSAQPDDALLAGKYYQGRQQHEYDGIIGYSGEWHIANLSSEQAEELEFYAWQENKKHTARRFSEKGFLYRGEELFRFNLKKELPHNYALAHKKIMTVLKNILDESTTRHTGPSCLFKYFAEHGIKCLGAETMYSGTEMLVGFLRGVAKDRDMEKFGVHHAVQWSTTPLDTDEHYKRFRLALYTAYMMGVTDINTEEGLWHLEEGFGHYHRFDEACLNHLKQQQDFYRYTSSHTRSGEFYSPVALVHGRDDGINFFIPDKIWGIETPFTSAEKSWELTKEIYPDTIPGRALYYHKSPADHPLGYYSATPYGNVDVIPAESKEKTMADYKLLVFMGYNNLTADDGQKLLNYIKNGGKVLMTRAHLTSTTDIEKVRAGELTFENSPFSRSGEEGALCTENIGKGTLYIFNTNKYPYDIKEQYAQTMKKLITQVQSEEPVWARCDKGMEFSCFKQKNGDTHIYFLAVDWYNSSKEGRKAVLKLAEESYCIDVPFGVLIKVVCSGDTAVWAQSENGEILEISKTGAKLQGTGKVTFSVAKNGKITDYQVDFTSENVKEINY